MAHNRSRGVSSTVDVRQARTRKALHEAILRAIVDRPLTDITVRDLANHAGIAYATFFRHYPNKETLLHDAAAAEIRRLVDITMNYKDVASLESCQLLCDAVDSQWSRWRALLTGSAHETVRKELLRIALEIAGPDPGTWPSEELAARLVVSGTIEILTWWLQREDAPRSRLVAQFLYDRVVHPGWLRNKASPT